MQMVSSERRKKPISLQEKILLDKQIFTPENKIIGPSISLFYHELTNKNPKLKRFTDITIGILVYLVHLLLKPLIVVGLKLSSGSDIYQKFTAVGKNGQSFQCKIYNIEYSQLDALQNKETPKGFSRFILRSGLYKLPLIHKVFKNELSLVGPQIFEENFAFYFSNIYTETYKRFSATPGLFSPSSYYSCDSVEENLRKDLDFVANQSFNKYIRILF